MKQPGFMFLYKWQASPRTRLSFSRDTYVSKRPRLAQTFFGLVTQSFLVTGRKDRVTKPKSAFAEASTKEWKERHSQSHNCCTDHRRTEQSAQKQQYWRLFNLRLLIECKLIYMLQYLHVLFKRCFNSRSILVVDSKRSLACLRLIFSLMYRPSFWSLFTREKKSFISEMLSQWLPRFI